LVTVLADRKKDAVVAFLRAMPETLRRTIECACTERYEGFGRALEEDGPWAEIVIERFHGARASRDCADTGCKRLKHARPKAEYAALQGVMWPLRKRPGELKPPAGELRERGFTCSPKIEAADNLREDLPALFDRGDTKAGATCAMRAWCTRVRASGLAEFESFLGTLDRGMDEITHDFQGRQTSGFVEGCNHRVKGLKRRCHGSFDVGRLFQQLTLDWHGSPLFGHTGPHNTLWPTTGIPGEPRICLEGRACVRCDTWGQFSIGWR
jgi:transposase